MRTLIWPGVRTAPALPRPGAHAEVQFPEAETKTRGDGLFGLTLRAFRKKSTAYVLVTWPGGSATRKVTGNARIRMVMGWCEAFNRISDSDASGASRAEAPGPTESGAA
ncbi:MAG: hypothetical protein ACRDPY_10350 [Streptosporangiaceae bacterium]